MKNKIKDLLEHMYRMVPGLTDEMDLQRHLSRGTLGTLAIHLGHIGLTLMISILLARWLGAEDYGSYTHVLAWFMVMVTAGSAGADDLLVRELPRQSGMGDQNFGKALVRETFLVTIFACGAISVAFLALLNWRMLPWLTEYQAYFYLLLPVLPVFALIYWTMAALKAEQHLLSAQWAEKIGRPAIFLIAGLVWVSISGNGNKLQTVFLLLALSVVFTLLLSAHLFFRKVWPELGGDQPSRAEQSRWRGQLLFFALLPLLNILNQRLDILLLGKLSTDEAVGIYSISSRLTEMIPFSLILFQNVFSPLYSKYHSTGKIRELEILVRRGIRLSLFLATPVALLLVVGGPWILNWFGPDFKTGYAILLTLSPVQVASIAIGPLAFLLMMTGHGKTAFTIMLCGLVFTAILQVFLIPLYDAQGAAFGRGAGLLITQAGYAWATWKKLRIRTL